MRLQHCHAPDFILKQSIRFWNHCAQCVQYQSSLTGKREKKYSGCMHNSFICKEKCACKNKQPDDVIRTATENDFISKRIGGQPRFSDSNTVGQCAVIFGRTVSGVRTEAIETIINRTRVKLLFLRIQLGVAAQLWRAELSLPCDSLPPHLARRPQNPYRLAPHLHCLAILASLPLNKKITSEIQK